MSSATVPGSGVGDPAVRFVSCKSRRRMQPLMPVGDDHAAGEIEAALGQELQRLRKRTGMSLRAFAQAVGFSASFISQVENGVASPSIASLGKMAAALDVTIPELFIASHTHEPVVVRAASRPGFRSAWSKARIDSLIAPGRSARLEALLVTLEAGGSSGKKHRRSRWISSPWHSPALSSWRVRATRFGSSPATRP